MYCTLSSILNIPSLVSYLYLSILINRSHASAPPAAPRPPYIPLLEIYLCQRIFQITHMPFPNHTHTPPPTPPFPPYVSIIDLMLIYEFRKPSLFQPLCLCFKVPISIPIILLSTADADWLIFGGKGKGGRREEGRGRAIAAAAVE